MKCKKTIDYRSYSHEALEKVRKDSVKRVESGESPEDVAIGLGLNRRTIYKWLSTYHYGGEEALNGKAAPGAPRKFDDKKLSKATGTYVSAQTAPVVISRLRNPTIPD